MVNDNNFSATATKDPYGVYKTKQSKLSNLLKKASDDITVLNMKQFKETLEELSKKTNNDTFKILVVGSFKNGKSTFINSFLGSEILPAYARPCTAVINEVKYGKEKKAILYFKNPLPSQLPAHIPEITMSYMRKYGKNPIPPIEIPVDKIEDYVVIPMGEDPNEMLMESPYEKIELFWSLDLLKNGVEIIDSPGLNEAEIRTEVVAKYLPKVDAVLFVLSAIALCGATEMSFIENNIRLQGFEDIHFLVNRFDLVSRREKEGIVQFAKLKLTNQTTLKEKGIFFVSALNALDGKIENDEEKYKNSGMPEFEKTLSEFLVNQKGKVKLSQPAKELKRILNDEVLYKIIPQQRGILESSLDDVRKRYYEAQPQLEKLRTEKDLMARRINMLIEPMIPEIRRYINNYYSDLSTKIPVWVNECKTETKVGLNLFAAKKKAEGLVREITAYVKDKIDEDNAVWKNNTLIPLVEDKVQNMLDSIESNLNNFFVELDNVQVDISGVKPGKTNTVPTWQRVAAAAGGLAFGFWDVAIIGGITGFSKDFAKNIAIELGAGLLLAIFGLLNPVTILMIAGGAIVNALLGSGNRIERTIKDNISEEIVKTINENAFDSVESMVDDIKDNIVKIGDVVVSSMDTEISEVNNQVNDIIKQMEKGQADIDKRKEELSECERKIQLLSTDLDNFIFDLVESSL